MKPIVLAIAGCAMFGGCIILDKRDVGVVRYQGKTYSVTQGYTTDPGARERLRSYLSVLINGRSYVCAPATEATEPLAGCLKTVAKVLRERRNRQSDESENSPIRSIETPGRDLDDYVPPSVGDGDT